MTTERLYYDDSYQLAFSAEVIERTTFKGKPALVLDRTYFYPEGGGQPADQGTLNGAPVVDVQTREPDRAVLHILAAPLDAPHVEGQIDRARRLDHMQHHSGQHVLSQALERAAHAATLSVHMSADSMTLDIDRADLTPDDWAAVEALANQIVLEDRPVRAWFPEPDELAALPIRKLPDVAGKVRIVDVGGFDITACGGTHVARTGEIGVIKVVKAERRGGGTRVEFRCGSRALRDYREKHDVVSRLMSALTVGHRELGETVARLQAENKALRADLKAAREQLADAEALVMLSGATLHGDWRVVARAFEGRSADEVRLLAQKLIAQPGTLALLGAAGDKAQLIFGRAADVDLDIVPVLKAALHTLGVERGGGRPDFAQGGGVSATAGQLQAALSAALSALAR
ncbi:MAG: alanyl-tRNA editing protein [Anaerolineae bacterium]|nr:alanyl-tRNA editing protein [Anaerolineae bacterium]